MNEKYKTIYSVFLIAYIELAKIDFIILDFNKFKN